MWKWYPKILFKQFIFCHYHTKLSCVCLNLNQLYTVQRRKFNIRYLIFNILAHPPNMSTIPYTLKNIKLTSQLIWYSTTITRPSTRLSNYDKLWVSRAGTFSLKCEVNWIFSKVYGIVHIFEGWPEYRISNIKFSSWHSDYHGLSVGHLEKYLCNVCHIIFLFTTCVIPWYLYTMGRGQSPKPR